MSDEINLLRMGNWIFWKKKHDKGTRLYYRNDTWECSGYMPISDDSEKNIASILLQLQHRILHRWISQPFDEWFNDLQSKYHAETESEEGDPTP